MHIVRIDAARRQDRLVDLGDRATRRGRHHRPEIPLRAVEPQIARCVRRAGANKRVIQLQRVFQQVFAPIDHPRLPPLGEFGPDRRRRIERRNPGPRRPQPFRQRSLRHQFGINLPGLVKPRERQHVGRPGRRGERADHLGDLAVLHQHADIGHPRLLRPAGGVAHQGQALRALLHQRLDQVERRARHRKPAERDGAAIGNVGHRLGETVSYLGLLGHRFPALRVAPIKVQAWRGVKGSAQANRVNRILASHLLQIRAGGDVAPSYRSKDRETHHKDHKDSVRHPLVVLPSLWLCGEFLRCFNTNRPPQE